MKKLIIAVVGAAILTVALAVHAQRVRGVTSPEPVRPPTSPLIDAALLVSNVCMTPYGDCLMLVPAPVGSACTCVNVFGAFPGIVK